jgi:hypothetical protein
MSLRQTSLLLDVNEVHLDSGLSAFFEHFVGKGVPHLCRHQQTANASISDIV